MARPVSLFISYAQKDQDLRGQLETHLALLKRQNLIESWKDRTLLSGQDYQGIIDDRIEQADIVVLLLTPSFMSSSYCYEGEMARAMELNQRGEIRVIPVLCRPCDLTGAPFAKLQGLPTNHKPIVKWGDTDEAWLDVVKGLRQVVNAVKDRPPRQPQTTSQAAAAPTAPSPAAAPPAASDPVEVLRHLERLLPAQFEKVVFYCDINGHVQPGDLPPASAPQAQRAMELIRFFRSRASGLQPLVAAIGQATRV